MRHVLDRLQRHDHLDRRTVGIGDDAAGRVLRIPGVDLRHDEGHVGIHAESARIINHNGPVPGDRLGELLRRTRSGRCQGEVDFLEIVVVLQQFDGKLLPAEFIGTARAALRTEQHQFVDREPALLQNPQKLLAHSAADAHNSNFHLDKVIK